MHAVLGRLLDHVRMADIPVTELTVRTDQGGYALRLSIETVDSEAIARLARRAGGIVGLTGLELAERGEPSTTAPPNLDLTEAA